MGYDDPINSATAALVTSDEERILRQLAPTMSPYELAAARWRDKYSGEAEENVDLSEKERLVDANYDRRGLLLTLTSALAEISKLLRSARELAAIEEATHGPE